MSSAPIPIDAIRARTQPWSVRARGLRVTDERTFALGGEHLRDIKALLAEIDAKCDPVIRAAHAAHRAALAQKKELAAELVEADRTIRAKLGAYLAEKERLHRQMVAAAEAEARAALQAAARAAAELEAAGESELAAIARAQLPSLPPAPGPAPSLAVQGIGARHCWHARVVDLRAFLQGVLDGKIPLAAVQVNERLLGQQARALREELDWPGVEVRGGVGVVVR